MTALEPPTSVLILCFASIEATNALADAQFVIDHGGQVTIVTARVPEQIWDRIDRRIRVVELKQAEGRHPAIRAERVAVFRLPRYAVGALRRTGVTFGRLRGGSRLGRAALRTSRRVEDARLTYAPLADKAYRATIYKTIRPVVLWRVAQHEFSRVLDIDSFQLILVKDSVSLPTAWHISRRHGGPRVTFHLERGEWPAGPENEEDRLVAEVENATTIEEGTTIEERTTVEPLLEGTPTLAHGDTVEAGRSD